MIEQLKNSKELFSYRNTFSFGLLQSKVYRLLKNHTKSLLSPSNIGTVEWALLGLVYTNKDGLRSVTLAQELGVELPFITAMIDKLEKKKLVIRKADKTDRRARLIVITKTGSGFVDTVEKTLKKESKQLVDGISKRDLLTYVRVLKHLEKNALAIHKEKPLKGVPHAWKE